MKNMLLPLLIVLLIIFESCNSDFDINTANETVYTLNCIIHNDSKIQYAVISENLYTEDGTKPGSNLLDQNVKGAVIKIFYNDSIFVMRDTSIQVNETQVNCYYVKDLIVKPGKTASIEASIPGGKILKSTIKTPKLTFGRYTNTIPQIYVFGENKFSEYAYKEIQNYNWDWATDKGENANFLSLPQIEINYKKIEGGTYVRKKIFVPVGYKNGFDRTGKLIYIIQQFSLTKDCISTLDDINKTMRQISGDDPYKSNYIITKVSLNVICLDDALSRYYLANDVFLDEFTIKIRQTYVTNIEGGKGIFGVYSVFTRRINVDKYYIQSFGYKYNPN